MLKLTAILISEHERINAMLEVLKQVSVRLKAEQPVDKSYPARIIRFLRGYADGVHHAKEEKLLFKAMEKHLPSQAGELVGELQADHTLAGMLVDSLAVAADSFASGETGAGGEFADAYCALLSHHICREDNVLFPMSDRELSEEAREEIENDHQKMLAELRDDQIEQDCLRILDDLTSAFSVKIEGSSIHGS